MQENKKPAVSITDASRLIIEAMARAGADTFIGYPITPANLLYQYATQRMPLMMAAPDEITTVQWMSGLAATGRIPVTATSFPGYALMIESINMAFMMELPMVIILVQRLGPATGTATSGAQGDLLLLRGQISGGYPIPVFATSSFQDCWLLSEKAVKTAVDLRTPVVLLTSKEEVMTSKSFDLKKLPHIEPLEREYFNKPNAVYKSYQPENQVPVFLSVTQARHQVRLNASTHDQSGILQHSTVEALENSVRLEQKITQRAHEFTDYFLDEDLEAETLIVSWGITAVAAKDVVSIMRNKGEKISLLIPRTLLPVPGVYNEIIQSYSRVVIAEESLNNQLGTLLFGINMPRNIRFAGGIGKMISPNQIIEEVVK